MNASRSKKPSRILRPEVVALQNASWLKLMREASEAVKSGAKIKMIGEPQTIAWGTDDQNSTPVPLTTDRG